MENLFKSDYLSKKENQGLMFNVLLGIIIVLFAGFFIFNLTVSVCSVDGNSMLDTLTDAETLLLEKNPNHINRGDIITISDMSSDLIIKRVMALEGDKLVFKQNGETGMVDLYRDIGEGYVKLDESEYIKAPMTSVGWQEDRKFFKSEYMLAPEDTEIQDFGSYAIVIKAGECFVMGDNRNDSSDSRKYGAGLLANVKGKMFYRVKKDSLLEKILLFIYKEKGEASLLWSK